MVTPPIIDYISSIIETAQCIQDGLGDDLDRPDVLAELKRIDTELGALSDAIEAENAR